MLLRLFALFALPYLISSIPVDNGVEGEPEIECGPTSIAVSFNTRNPFEGHVYVKGQFASSQCVAVGNGQQRTGSITLPFDSCNIQRTRSLNPNGLFIGTTVIISFHPRFETKVDKAYRVQCFYMEASKTVGTELEVSGLTTGIQTQVVPMPVCRYQILNGPNGQPVKFAIVGQPVFHKWTCDTETVNTFCMRVYGCFVDDGKGDRVDLLDDKGCAIDKYLLNNLEYPTDLMAGKEAHVFKYADRVALFFQCQIEITIKEPNGQCQHPQCADPTKGKRSVKTQGGESAQGPSSTIDVVAELSALDEASENDSASKQSRQQQLRDIGGISVDARNNVCLSPIAFGMFLALSVGLLVATLLASCFLYLRSRNSKIYV